MGVGSNPVDAIERFDFTLTDSDGDTCNPYIQLDLKFDDSYTHPITVDSDVIYEAELVNGDINVPISVDGYEVVDAEIAGGFGTVAQDADGNWIYVLSGSLDHGGEDYIPDYVTLTVRDEQGREFKVDKEIDIVDSKPYAGTFNLSVTSDDTMEFSVSSAEIAQQQNLDFRFYDFGMDNDPEKVSLMVITGDGEREVILGEETSVRGKYGTLQFIAEGNHIAFTYVRDTMDDAYETFMFKATDADGSICNPVINIDTRFRTPVNERDLLDGSAETQIGLPLHMEGFEIVDATVAGSAGHMRHNGDGTWSYVLDQAVMNGTHLSGDGNEVDYVEDTVTLTVRDVEGNVGTVEKLVRIVDSIPDDAEANVDLRNVMEYGGAFEPDENGVGLRCSPFAGQKNHVY